MVVCILPTRYWSRGTTNAVMPPRARFSASVTAKTTAKSASSPLVM